MKQLGQFTLGILWAVFILIIGKIIQSHLGIKDTKQTIYWNLLGMTIILSFSIWNFVESYFDLRLSSGIQGRTGKRGVRGLPGTQGQCIFPTYQGPLKDEKDKTKNLLVGWNKDNFIKIGPHKSAWYRTLEYLNGEEAGKVDGTLINGNPVSFRKCKQLCNSSNECKSFLYFNKLKTNKKTQLRTDENLCIFHNKNCDSEGGNCWTQSIKDFENKYSINKIDKEYSGLHVKDSV